MCKNCLINLENLEMDEKILLKRKNVKSSLR